MWNNNGRRPTDNRQQQPSNDDGQKRGPESLGDILGRLFTSRGWGRKSERLQLEEAWATASGEFATRTRVAGLRRGVLEVEVAPGALLQELAAFHKRRLLEAMKKALPNATVKEIRFRAGMV